jgi:hypothetical protein
VLNHNNERRYVASVRGCGVCCLLGCTLIAWSADDHKACVNFQWSSTRSHQADQPLRSWGEACGHKQHTANEQAASVRPFVVVITLLAKQAKQREDVMRRVCRWPHTSVRVWWRDTFDNRALGDLSQRRSRNCYRPETKVIAAKPPTHAPAPMHPQWHD